MQACHLLVVLLVVACVSPQPQAGGTSMASTPPTTAPTAGPTPAATPQPVSSPPQMPGPSSSPRLVAAVDFACRLPVTIATTPNSAAGRRQFISFPSGTLEDAGPAQSSESDSYSWVLGRWSVHGLSSFSPDGYSYAWSEFGSDGGQVTRQPARQHVTDGRTGVDRVVHQGDFLAVLAWSTDGIYMTEAGVEGSQGLHLMDPATGSVRQVDSSGGYVAVAGGGGWRTGDTTYGPQRELTRRDLQTGAAQTWYSTGSSGYSIQPLGFDAQGHPLLRLYREPGSESRVVVLSAPEQARQAYQGTDRLGGTVFLDKSASVADSHGVWIAGQDGLWFFDGSFRRVISGLAVRPAGECR